MKTNALKFTDSRTAKNGEQWVIKIRLDDECKNGHQDFSITGTCWEAEKPRTDKYMILGGACGDEISVLFPEYEIFNRLHLCDYKGIPMHCSANGYYHLNKGFHSKSTGESFEKSTAITTEFHAHNFRYCARLKVKRILLCCWKASEFLSNGKQRRK
jgi:methionyl-tRNA synthetase